jgi:hypothetical protein
MGRRRSQEVPPLFGLDHQAAPSNIERTGMTFMLPKERTRRLRALRKIEGAAILVGTGSSEPGAVAVAYAGTVALVALGAAVISDMSVLMLPGFVLAGLAGFVGYKTSKYGTHRDRLYGLLAAYEPLAADDYRRLQVGAKADLSWEAFRSPLGSWLAEERALLEGGTQKRACPGKEAFVGKHV